MLTSEVFRGPNSRHTTRSPSARPRAAPLSVTTRALRPQAAGRRALASASAPRARAQPLGRDARGQPGRRHCERDEARPIRVRPMTGPRGKTDQGAAYGEASERSRPAWYKYR